MAWVIGHVPAGSTTASYKGMVKLPHGCTLITKSRGKRKHVIKSAEKACRKLGIELDWPKEG